MPDIRVAFLGDSVTHGVGDGACLGWPGRLWLLERARGTRFTAYNLGIRSDTSRDISRRWAAECAARLPGKTRHVYVFSLGLNDATRVEGALRVELAESLDICASMLSKARRLGIVLWVGPTPIDDASQPLMSSLGILQTKSNKEIARYNEAFSECARAKNVPYLNLYSALYGDPRWRRLLSDGVHPHEDGYDVISRHVHDWSAWRRAVSGDDPAPAM